MKSKSSKTLYLRDKLKEVLIIYESTNINIPPEEKQSIYYGLILAYQSIDQYCQKQPRLSLVKSGSAM